MVLQRTRSTGVTNCYNYRRFASLSKESSEKKDEGRQELKGDRDERSNNFLFVKKDIC